MIHTITFNPGIDLSLRLEVLRKGEVQRPEEVIEHAGGKGMNVSIALSRLEVPTRAWVFLGGTSGEKWKNLASEYPFEIVPIGLSGETRQNIKVFETESSHQTDLNLPGPRFEEEAFNHLLSGLTREVQENDFVVVAGSALPETPSESWVRLGKILRANQGRLVVDTSGRVLDALVECHPYLVKINLSEFNEWKKTHYTHLDEVIEDPINLNLPHHLVLTDGSNGSVGISTEGICERGPCYPATVQGTVGAGDAFTAGFLSAWQTQEGGWRNALAWGAATAAGAVELPGTAFPTRDRVLEILTRDSPEEEGTT